MDNQEIVTEEIARVLYYQRLKHEFGVEGAKSKPRYPDGPEQLHKVLQSDYREVGFALGQAKVVMKYFKLDL